MEIIQHHQVIPGDKVELSCYFYQFREAWTDMANRIKSNQFKSVIEMMNQRKVWRNLTNERTTPKED
jgi:hypothetical protein